MIRIAGNLKPPRSLGRPVATIGAFDGVHKGHQRVLAELRRWAGRLGTRSLVVTFDRNPKSLTRGERVPCITSLEHRLVLLERAGIDAAAVLRFDRRLRTMSARDFVVKILCGKLRARGVLLGFNGRFGRNAEGDFALLRQMEKDGVCEARGCERPVRVEGELVSSSAIRAAVEAGELRCAERMLGRRVSVLGTVVHGRGVGRTLGFPTANLDLHQEVKPPSAVYATEVCIAGRWMASVTSIGHRPTFSHPTREPVVEVLIPGLRRNLYGRDLEVRFIRRLREQIRFGSPEELAAQIARDVEEVMRRQQAAAGEKKRRGQQWVVSR